MRIDMKQDQQVKWECFWAAFCAIAVFLILQVLLTCGMLHAWFPNIPTVSNLFAYVITLILFVISFFVFLLIFRRIPMKKTAEFMDTEMTERAYKVTFVTGSTVLLLFLAIRRLFIERTEFAATSWPLSFHMFPLWMAIPLFVLVAGTAVYLSFKLQKNWDISGKMLYYGTAGILLLNFITVLVLNLFHGDIHHGVAYIEPIYNVYYGTPFTRFTMGIYGFYGLFLAPVLHLFNGNAQALLITIALLGFLVALLCVYCIWSLVEENYFRILALLMCCLSTISMRARNYWQVQPHRVIWPLILIAFLIYLVKKDCWRKRDKLLGYCLCTAAVLWNVESGLFCSIAFAAACIVHDWQQNVWYHPQSVLRCLAHVVCLIATVASAIMIVNGYNYLCGYREWFLKDFFFPMFESSYVSDLLEVDMPIGNHAWVYVLVLFGSLLLASLCMTKHMQSRAESGASYMTKFAPVMMAVAMLGLCSFSYYANRAAYRNLDIILQLAGIATCILWKVVKSKLFQRNGTRKDCAKTIVSYVSIVLTITLAIEAFMFSVPLLVVKCLYKHYDTHSYLASCELLEETIPQDTFAFGGGIAMMYAELGWDPIGHYRDVSDLRVGGGDAIEVIVEDVLKQDSFAVYISTERENEVLEKILYEEPAFRIAEEVELNGKTLQYYIRSVE